MGTDGNHGDRDEIVHVRYVEGNMSDRMIFDRGTTSRMTRKADWVHNCKSCEISTTLADNSTVTTGRKGTRTGKCKSTKGVQKFHRSETRIAPDVVMSLLSVPSLVKKNNAVIFPPGAELRVDLDKNLEVIGTAAEDAYGLFYIQDTMRL